MKQLKLFVIIFVILIGLAITVTSIKKMGFWITYQATPSMRQGFYAVLPIKHIKRRDTVIFTPSKTTSLHFLLKHRWVPQNGLLLKRVVGVPGDFVCKKQGFIWINRHKMGRVYKFYRPGKRLPNNSFCRQLKKKEYLLMSMHIQRSFDGRYFGPVTRDHILGRAKYLF